jgi:uncharacterized protein YciI
MAVAIWLEDSAAAPALRQQHLAAHLEFVERALDDILVAGPLRDPATGANVGSLYVLDVADEAGARAWLARDPYHVAGVWARVTVRPFAGVAGRWVGGAAWKKG